MNRDRERKIIEDDTKQRYLYTKENDIFLVFFIYSQT